jgi:hypothetical protein
MDSIRKAYLDIPELGEAASVANIIPSRENKPLLSVGQLYDDGYSVMSSMSEAKKLD